MPGQQRTSDMTEKYKVREKLGRGAFAVVRRCVRKADSTEFALKVVRKKGMDNYNLSALESEVAIMKQISRETHPHIITLHDMYDTPNHLHMIIDLATGGELFDRIVEEGGFSEAKAARIIWQVADALDFLHQRNIVHRDLKPENIIYKSKDPDSDIMLVDFGLAKIHDGGSLTTPCGSPQYVAPEIVANRRKPYGPPVDCWSLGVILYILLCAFPPFLDESGGHNQNLKGLYRRIRQAAYSFPSPYWDDISDEAKDLIRKLLQPKPAQRATAPQVKAHHWIASSNTNTNQLSGAHLDRLKALQLRQTLRRGVNTILAVLRMKQTLLRVEGRR